MHGGERGLIEERLLDPGFCDDIQAYLAETQKLVLQGETDGLKHYVASYRGASAVLFGRTQLVDFSAPIVIRENDRVFINEFADLSLEIADNDEDGTFNRIKKIKPRGRDIPVIYRHHSPEVVVAVLPRVQKIEMALRAEGGLSLERMVDQRLQLVQGIGEVVSGLVTNDRLRIWNSNQLIY